MFPSSFWKLVCILWTTMERDTAGSEWQGSAWNGVITASQRLSMGLRSFDGGSVYDIAGNHGICVQEVYESVHVVIDAINSCESFDIVLPESEEEQQKLADGSLMKSRAGFKNCVGAIDGILVWTEKPSISDLMSIHFRSTQFYCEHKSKHGLIMQAVCDMNGRFLDIFIGCPGATSDYLAFSLSPLKHKLDAGLLKKDFCIFGDNAYVNTLYMATPYRNATAGNNDDYNFYHSQVSYLFDC